MENKKKMKIIDILAIISFIFFIILVIYSIYYVTSLGYKCVSNPINYYQNLTGADCFCVKIPRLT